MILLVSASSSAERLAEVLQQRLDERVQTAENVRRARSLARGQAYSAVVVDESSIDPESAAEPLASDDAVVVSANLAIQDAERIAREVRSALRRAERQRTAAAELAARQLRAQVAEELTQALLAADLAAKTAGLPPLAQARIQSVVEAVQRLRQKLEQAPS